MIKKNICEKCDAVLIWQLSRPSCNLWFILNPSRDYLLCCGMWCVFLTTCGWWWFISVFILFHPYAGWYNRTVQRYYTQISIMFQVHGCISFLFTFCCVFSFNLFFPTVYIGSHIWARARARVCALNGQTLNMVASLTEPVDHCCKQHDRIHILIEILHLIFLQRFLSFF